MVDGKTLNKMTDNNCTQRCPYCHLLPREYMKKGVDGYEFSAKAMEAFEDLIFCPLHFGLRTWDNLMRLSCLLKLDTPAPRVYGERNHLMFECQKLLIQERCAREKGLLVDIPTGKGGTSTRGHKGAKSRSGYSKKIGFEGGQMPLQRRVPKFGFTNINRVLFNVINLDTLQNLVKEKKIKNEVTLEKFVELRMARKKELIKIQTND